MPETMPSFFEMFLLIAAARGARSASTKLPAKELVSMPEPAPNLLVTLDLATLVEPDDEVAGGVAVVEEIEVAIRFKCALNELFQPLPDVLEQRKLRHLGKAGLRSLQRQQLFLHQRNSCRHVEIFNTGQGCFKGELGVI